MHDDYDDDEQKKQNFLSLFKHSCYKKLHYKLTWLLKSKTFVLLWKQVIIVYKRLYNYATIST